jgi:hypothetical protein
MASELAAISPPAAVGLLHRDLIRDTRTIANALGWVAAASQANDTGAANAPLGETSAALGDLAATINAIDTSAP